MTLSLALDFIVIGLLIATIVYAVILNRKLSALNNSKEELKGFLETFAASLAQAKAGVEHLKKVSYESSQGLQDQIRQGKALKDELGFFIENGEKAIARMEKSIKMSRGEANMGKPSPSPQPGSGKSASPTQAVHKGDSTPTPSSVAHHPKTRQPRPKAPPQQPKVEPRLVQALRGLR